MAVERGTICHLAVTGGLLSAAVLVDVCGGGGAATATVAAKTGLWASLGAVLAGGAGNSLWNVVTGFYSEKVQRWNESGALRARGTENHDLHRLIGDAIVLILREQLAKVPRESDASLVLETLVKECTLRWPAITLPSEYEAISEPGIDPLFTGEPSAIKASPVLSVERWEALLREWWVAPVDQARHAVIKDAALALRSRFAGTLWELAKRAWKTDDLAWPALNLRLLSGLSADTKEIKRAVATLTLGVHTQTQAIVERIEDRFDDLDRAILRQFDADRKELAGVLGGMMNSLADLLVWTDESVRLQRETAAMLKAFGYVPALQSNVPPDPFKHVVRPKPMAELRAALLGDGTASVVGRASAATGGGYGKTVLAFHYAHAHRSTYTGGIFHVGCKGRGVVPALAALLPSIDELIKLSEVDRAKLVRSRLSAHEPSLLILDNIDDAAHWAAYRDSGLLPGPPCHIIVTTRDEAIRDLPKVAVDKLERQEAIDLLANFKPSAKDPKNVDAIEVVLRETERLAALVAAVGAAMVEDVNDDWAGYAAWLKDATPDELPDAGEWHKGYTNYPEKTAAILDDLRRRLHPAMVRVLDYAALLPADAIAPGWLEFLLERDTKPDAPGGPLPLPMNTMGKPHSVGWILDRLRDRDLLRRASETSTLLSVHRLHRKRAADHLAANGVEKETRLDAVVVLAEARGRASHDAVYGPKGEADETKRVEARDVLRVELTPLSMLIDNLEVGGRAEFALRLAIWLSTPMRDLARHREGFANLDRFLDLERARADELLTSDHATALSNLALIQKDQGNLPGARGSIERAIAVQEMHLAQDHPHFATSYSNLATIQQDQGDLSGALASLERATVIDKSNPGTLPRSHAIRSSIMALLLKASGDLLGARRSIDAAIAVGESSLASDDPDVAVWYANLATIQKDQGDLPGARKSLEHAIAIWSKHFAPDHPYFATSSSNLSTIQFALRDLQGARASMERAIAIEQKHFAPNHPTFGISYSNLATICHAEGNRPQAAENFRKALRTLLLHFDESHPYVKNLRRLMQQGSYAE